MHEQVEAIGDADVNDSQVVHRNPWFSISRREVGSVEWFRVERPDSAMIVGTTPDGRLLLIRGRRDTTGDRALLEFPCGAIEPRESPADAAIRETLEETGYRASNLVALGSVVESPGISGASCHVFRAEVTPDGSPALEPGESWVVEILTRDALGAAVRRGEVRDAGTLAALSLLLFSDV